MKTPKERKSMQPLTQFLSSENYSCMITTQRKNFKIYPIQVCKVNQVSLLYNHSKFVLLVETLLRKTKHPTKTPTNTKDRIRNKKAMLS